MQIIPCIKDSRRYRDGDSSLPQYDPEACNRHILVFGEQMQQRLSELTVGVCSLGGLGMLLLESLMRLYPHKLVVTDLDKVARSNLNRLTGSTALDARLATPKTELAARHVWSFNPDQELVAIEGNFLDAENQEQFRECDVIFSGFDRLGPRLAANQLCQVHGIVLFDIGVGAKVEEGKLASAGAQVIRVNPAGGFCLSCGGFYDKTLAAADFLDDAELQRQAQMGYVRGAQVAAPQVYALNMMAASWAIWMFMRMVAGEMVDFDGIAIDAFDWSTRTWSEERQTPNGCPICGEEGIAMTGDNGSLLFKAQEKGSTEALFSSIVLDNSATESSATKLQESQSSALGAEKRDTAEKQSNTEE